MKARYFTLDEANALLPQIEPLMGQLLNTRDRAARLSQSIKDLLETRGDFGNPTATTLAQDFATIERLIEQIQAYGCVIKDLNGGLLDFLAQKNGRDVYLCWRYGESKIEYYHELHTGFAGRQLFE